MNSSKKHYCGELAFEYLFMGNPLIKTLISILYKVFHTETLPTATNLIALVLSYFVLNTCPSIHSSYLHFVCDILPKSLNSLYHTITYSKIDIFNWTKRLIDFALQVAVPVKGKTVFILSIDDTLVSKYGKAFACVARLFDHSAKDKNQQYINGHCFVSIVLTILVSIKGKEKYVSFPIIKKMWEQGGPTKHDMVYEMVKNILSYIGDEIKVVLLYDSWYPKGAVLKLEKEFHNVHSVFNARVDTALFDEPEKSTGRGRPRKWGNRIYLKDFPLKEVSGSEYLVGKMNVFTRLFGCERKVSVLVTQPVKGGSRRLFICTNDEALQYVRSDLIENKQASALVKADKGFLPLAVYSFRWNIEVSFLELKTFWNLKDYRVRSKEGIERVVNLQMVAYSLSALLPCLDPAFAHLLPFSNQERRFKLGQVIHDQLIIGKFVNTAGFAKNSVPMDRVYSLCGNFGYGDAQNL